MESIVKVCKIFVLSFVGLLLVYSMLIDTVQLGNVGVRRSNVRGVVAQDLEPGWRLEVVGFHKVIELPSTYQFINFTNADTLEIRTKDNNIVTLDISVPYRITPGSAWEIVSAGNHIKIDEDKFRFQRLTRETTVGVLRQHLADLQSSDFYDTDRRNVVAERALEILNEELAPLHVEANAILIRAVYFRAEYEKQLLQIQLNAQNKLLDGARKQVADVQQKLDNYQQKTRALASAREQDWAARLARLDRVYQVGFLSVNPMQTFMRGSGVRGVEEPEGEEPEGEAPEGEAPEGEAPEGEAPEGEAPEGEEPQGETPEGETPDVLAALSEEEIRQLEALAAQSVDLEPGAARRVLDGLTKAQRTALIAVTAEALGGETNEYGDNYLLGIKNIQAETLAYDQEVRAEADGVSARLSAEGQAQLAEVMGNYESRINQLLDSPAGRAFVAWQAAANVHFASELTFQSSDGIPSVLRLRDFARAFMGD